MSALSLSDGNYRFFVISLSSILDEISRFFNSFYILQIGLHMRPFYALCYTRQSHFDNVICYKHYEADMI